MNLDRRHLVGALALLAGSVTYNAWVFAGPESSIVAPATVTMTVNEGSAVRQAPARVSVSPHGAHRPEAAADVMLDRPPVWTRDPFMGRPAAPLPAVVAPAAAPAPAEAQIVLDSVLYSSTRKLAMINGRTVRIGDRVGGTTVVDILPDAILVESASGGVRTIRRRTAAPPVARK